MRQCACLVGELSHDKKKYPQIFNCGEEKKRKVTKGAVFATPLVCVFFSKNKNK